MITVAHLTFEYRPEVMIGIHTHATSSVRNFVLDIISNYSKRLIHISSLMRVGPVGVKFFLWRIVGNLS